MTLPADAAYAKTRTDLKQFEDAAFAALRSFVPNFFRDGREDTMWGWHLRGIAQRMAQLDFRIHYMIYGADPAMLTPADLLRRYGGPLHLNRNYPGTTQLDTDFKAMVLRLLEAYRLGATTKSIAGVIRAFTGEDYEVEELYRSIGDYYDASDRNALRIGVKLQASNNDALTVAGIARVKDVVTDLYGAIDLAKPAHVGINLTTVMREDPEVVILNIRDTLTFTMLLEEADPLDPMLYQSPFQSTAHPDTGLSPAILNLTYRWYKNGLLVGSDSPTLTLDNLQLADDGSEVWAEVTDTILGKVWSKRGVISVHDGAGQGTSHIIPQRPASKKATSTLVTTANPFSRIVLVNGSATFEVAAKNSIVPGVLAPHLNQAWEIKSDTMFGLDLD